MNLWLRAIILSAILMGTPLYSLIPTQAKAPLADVLDINTASLQQLTNLPGMGDAYAKRVIAARPYTAKNQLVTRGVLPASAYEQIKDRIVAHRAKAVPTVRR